MRADVVLMVTHTAFAVALLALAAMALRAASSLRRRLAATPREVVFGVGAASVVALLLSLALVAPAFVHDAFHGPLIVNGVLAFPAPPGRGSYGEAYGPGSFVVLGLLSRLTGRSAEGVMAANAIVAALATIAVAAASARLAGRPRAGLYAALLWASSPLVARLAHSEDAHVVGVAFALGGVALADVAASERSRTALLAAVLATALAVWSRQTLILFAPFVAALLIERTRRAPREAALAGRSVALACVALACVALARAWATATSPDGREGLVGLSLMLAHPEWLPGLLASHPLFSVPRLPLVVPLLFAIGAATLVRTSAARWSLTAAWLAIFALTLPSAFPSLGVRWSFRLPSYALCLVVAGAGAAWLEAAWQQRSRRTLGAGARAALALATLGLGATASATLANRAPNAELVEYVYLRDTLARLGPGITLIGYEEAGPAWRLPALLAERSGVPVVRPEALPTTSTPGTRYLMLEGLGCYAFDVLELAGAERAAAHQLPPRDEVRRLLTIMMDPRHGFGLASVRHPEGPRPACARVLARAASVGPAGPTITLDDSPPTAIFGRAQLTLRLVEWRAAQ